MSKRGCDVYTRACVALTRVRAMKDRFFVPNLVKLQRFYEDSSQTNGKMCSLFNSRIFTTRLQGNVWLPPCHTFPCLKLFAGAISLCLRQIRMKVRSFTKFDQINRSKAVVLGLYMKTSTNTVKPLLSRRLWDLPKCPLVRLLCNVIKFYVVTEAVLYFVQKF